MILEIIRKVTSAIAIDSHRANVSLLLLMIFPSTPFKIMFGRHWLVRLVSISAGSQDLCVCSCIVAYDNGYDHDK